MGKTGTHKERYGALLAGLVLLWPNVQHSFFRMSLTGRLGEHSLLYYAVSLATITVCSVAIFFLHRRVQNLYSRRWALVPIASVGALVSALSIMALPNANLSLQLYDAVALIATVLWSLALCVILFAWLSKLGTLLFELDMRIVIGIAAVSGVLGFFLMPVMLFDTPYYRAVAVVCLCASGIVWTRCERSDAYPAADTDSPSNACIDLPSLGHWGMLFAAYLLASVLHSIFYAMDAAIDLAMYALPCYAIVGAFGAIIALSAFSNLTGSLTGGKRASWYVSISMSIGLFVGLLLAMILFDYGNREANLNFMSAANRYLQILIFVALLLLIYQQRTSPIVVFALLFMSVEVLSNLICYFIVPAIIGYFELDVASSITAMSSIISVALIATLVFSLVVFALSDSMKTIAFERGEDEQDMEGGEKLEEPTHARRCADAAQAFALTQREQDVLYYLALGYNAKKTAQTLYVSFETVRSHTSSIYRKMGIHSKQELIDRIGGR